MLNIYLMLKIYFVGCLVSFVKMMIIIILILKKYHSIKIINKRVLLSILISTLSSWYYILVCIILMYEHITKDYKFDFLIRDYIDLSNYFLQ